MQCPSAYTVKMSADSLKQSSGWLCLRIIQRDRTNLARLECWWNVFALIKDEEGRYVMQESGETNVLVLRKGFYQNWSSEVKSAPRGTNLHWWFSSYQMTTWIRKANCDFLVSNSFIEDVPATEEVVHCDTPIQVTLQYIHAEQDPTADPGYLRYWTFTTISTTMVMFHHLTEPRRWDFQHV